MSPGALTERLTLFVAAYEPGVRPETGGLESEGEAIEFMARRPDHRRPIGGR